MRPKHWNVSDTSTQQAGQAARRAAFDRRYWLCLVGLTASLSLFGLEAAAQSTRGSAGSLVPPPAQLGAQGQAFGAAGGTRGSAGGAAVLNQPVNFARPVEGLPSTPDQISTTPQFGVAAGGSSPFLAGQASNAGLPLVSEDYEQLGGFDATPLTSVTGPAAAPSGPPQSYLAILGSPYSQQAEAPSGAPVSVGPGGAAPSGPPKSTLLVASPSGINYATLPSSLDSRPTQRSSNEGERNVSTTKSGSGSLPTLAPLKLPSSGSSSSDQTAKADSSSNESRTTPSLSLTAPSSTTRPSLSLSSNEGDGGDEGDGDASGDAANGGTALTIPKLPTLSLSGSSGASGGTGLSLSSGAAPKLPSPSKPTNFQIAGYRGGSTNVPAASLSQLNALARAMAGDPKIKVRLVSYAQTSGQISARTLSATRAVLVRKHLIQAGVDESRVSIRARGDNNGAVTSDRIDVEVQG